MNIDKLYIGQEFKNFKCLCEALGIKYKSSGKQRIAQIADVARHICWEKGKGRRIVILEIYSTPLIKDDKRSKGNRSIYVPHAKPLILNFLVKRSEAESLDNIIFANELFRELGIINDKYRDAEAHQKDFAKNNKDGIVPFDLEFFFEKTTAKNYRVLSSALNHMQRRSLITWEKRHKIQIGTDSTWKTASEVEEELIRNIEKEVLETMKLRDEFQAIWRGRGDEFHARVKHEIPKEYGWYDIRNGYLIRFHKSLANPPKELLLHEAELTQHKYALNDLIIEFTNRKAREYHTEKKKDSKSSEDGWGEPSEMGKSKKFKYDRHFLTKQLLLSELWIRLPQNKKT